MRKLSVLLFGLFVFFQVFSQDFNDTIYSPLVRSVKFYNSVSQLAYPVITLGSDETLTLRFDILQSQAVNLEYSFIHCSWDWSEEDIFPDDCIDGYYQNRVWNYSQSFNTYVSYFNYTVIFPNENVRFRLSGNYLLRITLANNPDSVILQKRFVVVERNIPIEVQVKPATEASLRATHQEVDVSFDISGHNIQQPWDYLRLAIYQNFRPDRVSFIDQPKFYQGNRLVYDYEDLNVFPGGNEFRTFSSVDYKFKSGRIFKAELEDTIYHCYLLPDNILNAYASYRDANGNFIIRANNVSDAWTQGDYVVMHFSLWTKRRLSDADLYLFGGFSNWKIRPEYKLKFNPATGAYEGAFLMKQGIYDYEYVFWDKGRINEELTEGDFYQTLNDYLIFVYYLDQAPYYWRVVGYRFVHMK